MPGWNGLTGSTIADYRNPSETFHQQNEKGRIVVNWRSRVKQPDSNKPVSRITGEVHPGVTRFENRNTGPSHGRKHTELDE
jgi:hypothetical protein